MLTPITLGASERPSLARSSSAEKDFELVIGELFVTKKEIVKTISEEIGLTQLKTKEIVQKTFDAIVETLVEDHRIELRNFGVFEVKRRAARKARNPRTGEKVFVPEKFVVTFKPGKEMEERVRELERRANEAARQQALQSNHGGPSHTRNTWLRNELRARLGQLGVAAASTLVSADSNAGRRSVKVSIDASRYPR
jgi:nucleoid DNA-binding protein